MNGWENLHTDKGHYPRQVQIFKTLARKHLASDNGTGKHQPMKQESISRTSRTLYLPPQQSLAAKMCCVNTV